MKRTLSLIIIVCWVFAACQATPGNTIVENKNDSDLKEAILKTVEPTNENKSEEYEEIVHISKVAINDSGTVTVNIDADVINPIFEGIEVVKAGKYAFTQSDIDKMIKAFFGEDLVFIDPFVETKEEIEETILKMQLKLTNDSELIDSDLADASGTTDLNELRKLQEERIQEQKDKLAQAPDQKPQIPKLTIEDGGWAAIANESKTLGFVRVAGDSARYYNFECWNFDDGINKPRQMSAQTVERVDNVNEEIIEVKEVAQGFINKIGIDGLVVGDVFISKDNMKGDPLIPWDFNKVVVSEREFYVVCFERLIGDHTLDYSLYKGNSSSEGYDIPYPYERIEVWVENNNVVQFRWSAPIEIKEKINDNAALQINYEQALDLSINNLFYKYAYLMDQGRAESVVADINEIALEMVRLKEADTNNYIIIPAWKIYGIVKQTLTQEESSRIGSTKVPDEDEFLNPDDYVILTYVPNIVTINALDGSVIDMKSGY